MKYEKFQTVGQQYQITAKNQEEANKRFEISCYNCSVKNLHLSCEECAIKQTHELCSALFRHEI